MAKQLAIPYGKTYHIGMTLVSITKARATLYALVARLQGGQDPVLITGKQGNAVLVSEDDWRSIEETLYLLSVPGMRESIRSGMREPIAKCATNIDL
jgi:antitoxin YefM